MARLKFSVKVHEEHDGSFWAEVEQLPGCFASGHDFQELKEALVEAVTMCLPEGIELDESVSVEQVSKTEALVYA